MIDRYVNISGETFPYIRIVAKISRFDSKGWGETRRYEPTRASQRRLADLVSKTSLTVEIEDDISITARIVKRKTSKLDAWIERTAR